METDFPTKERERLLFLAAPWYNSLVGYYTFDFKALFLAPSGQPEKMAHTTTALRLWYTMIYHFDEAGEGGCVEAGKTRRVHLMDELRGVLIIGVVLYHPCTTWRCSSRWGFHGCSTPG